MRNLIVKQCGNCQSGRRCVILEDMTYDLHSQCLSCTASDMIRHEIDSWTGTYAELSRHLMTKFEYKVSSDALSNHLRFHSNPMKAEEFLTVQGGLGDVVTPEVKEQPLKAGEPEDGVAEIDGVRYFKKLKSQWQNANGEWLSSYEYTPVGSVDNHLDFTSLTDHLVKVAGGYKTKNIQIKENRKRIVVTQFADLQVGKVGSRGDSFDLTERVLEFREKMEEYIIDSGAQRGVFGDLGDVVESFENTPQQMFTNDLSIMEQIELAALIEQDLIVTQANLLEKVDIVGVPSNHGAWRSGKGYLGRPGDDWGLFILKQIQNAFGFSPDLSKKVSFHIPEDWEKTISLDLGSEVLGFAHGDDCSQDKTPDWWAKQVHGNSPIARATMLLTGHYHNLRIQNSGRREDGRMKWWLSGNSMDNGSDWWKHKAGHDSSPGVTMFIIDEETGFDLKSLTVL